MKILIVLLIGAAVYFLLKGLSISNKYLAKKYPAWIKKINMLPGLEFIVWLIFIFWADEFLFEDKSYYQYLVLSLVIIVVAFLSWFVAKDFIAGIVFKVQNDFETNNNIRVGDISGKIKSQHITHLKLETNSGQTVKIPYSRITPEIVSEVSDSTQVAEYRFILPAKKTSGKQDAIDKIRFLIINSPWSNYNKVPTISLLSENDTHYMFEVTVNTLNHKHQHHLEKSIREQLMDE